MLVELDVVTLDFETYFDSDYTLSKMTTEEYIRDSRFEVHGLGVRFPCGKKVFYENPNEFLDKLPGFTVFLCHHAQFDGLILNHHFNVRPSIWFDTYSMAKYLFDASQPKGLGALAKHYCLPDKSVPYETVKGKQWKDLPLEDQIELSEGCKHDCELTYQIFIKMMQTFPESELKLIDLTIRMFTEPRLQGNVELLKSIAHNERETKNEKLIALGVSETQLASADQFTLLLKDAEVSIAYKQGKNKPIPAVAKSDGFMQDLLNSDDAYIADLAAARIAVKSTLNETRATRIALTAERGALPIYLHYCGAHTRRWSGGDNCNYQNLRRKSMLREAIKAPNGYLLATPDQSQGECRILNWLARNTAMLDKFRNGDDPYTEIATKFYGREITKNDVSERGTGKQGILSCGFGCGWKKFQRTAALGAYGPPVDLSDSDSKRFVNIYREDNYLIVNLWKEADNVLCNLNSGDNNIHWRGLTICNHRIYHSNGTWLDYSNLKYENGEWRLNGRHEYTKMYGAKLVENVVQWLSRIITAEAMVKLSAVYRVVGMAHDDVWLLIPNDEAVDGAIAWIKGVMSHSPTWAPDLPLAADCKVGKTLS